MNFLFIFINNNNNKKLKTLLLRFLLEAGSKFEVVIQVNRRTSRLQGKGSTQMSREPEIYHAINKSTLKYTYNYIKCIIMTCSFLLSGIKPSHFRSERVPKVWVNNSVLTISLVASEADGKILKYKKLEINYFFQSKGGRISQCPLQHKLNVKLKAQEPSVSRVRVQWSQLI